MLKNDPLPYFHSNRKVAIKVGLGAYCNAFDHNIDAR